VGFVAIVGQSIVARIRVKAQLAAQDVRATSIVHVR
jgi:hypothetical protein